jgi:4-oxalocrotonate tautomerase
VKTGSFQAWNNNPSLMPVVTITMSRGKTYDQKKKLTEEVTKALITALGVPQERVTILIHELEKENIALQGTLLTEQK